MKKTRKALLLKAHKEACGDWKTKIQNEWPKLFKHELPELNKWHHITVYEGSSKTMLVYITKFTEDGKSFKGFGFNLDGNWNNYNNNFGWGYHRMHKKADDSVVAEYIQKEAERRGYGSENYISLSEKPKMASKEPEFVINFNADILKGWDVYGCYFKKGIWATLISDIKEEDMQYYDTDGCSSEIWTHTESGIRFEVPIEVQRDFCNLTPE